jgi:hypothetical protein
MRFAIIATLGIILLAACSPSTGTGSRACERARAESHVAADALEAAMNANAPLGGHVERVEHANEEMNRACELGIVEPPAPAQASAADVETPLGPNTYYVSVDVTDERTAAGGGVVENSIYRGQRVEVTDRSGDWVRVTGLQYTPRWVRASHLSRERPAPLPQRATQVSCERLEADRGMADAMRIIADSVINTTDPAEVERLQTLKDDARAALEEIQARIDACEAAQ